MDELTNSKILVVSSPVMFLNMTNEVIVITLKDKTLSTQSVMPPQSENLLDHQTPLPIGYVKATFSLRFQKCDQFSDALSIDKLLGLQSLQNSQ